jgi:hypothetical protein
MVADFRQNSNPLNTIQRNMKRAPRQFICFTWTEEGPADVEIVDYHY